jgi:hypothetical protein
LPSHVSWHSKVPTPLSKRPTTGTSSRPPLILDAHQIRHNRLVGTDGRQSAVIVACTIRRSVAEIQQDGADKHARLSM